MIFYMVTRAIARKLKLKTITESPYTAGGTIDNPNHITVGNEKIIRVNTTGEIEDKYESPEANFSSLTIKDNDSEIKVKFFEKINLDEFQKGNLVKVIGKVREANEERFILGEIVKKIQPEYLKIREEEIFKPINGSSEKTEKPVIEEMGSV